MAEQQLSSTCGTYELKGAPFIHTGEKSNKIFRMALGHLASGRDEVKMNVNLRDAAREGHTVPGGLRNNLYSVSALTQAGYGAVFDKDYFAVVDADEVSRMISRHAILKGFYSPDEGLWRIPLGDVKGAKRENYGAGETIATRQRPIDILRDAPAPPAPADLPDDLANVYELRANPQIIRYYHAAAGFPTKPTWINAIENGHYSSWKGLTVDLVRRHYPEADETWKGHGRKIKMNIRSTKQLLKDEAANTQQVMELAEQSSEQIDLEGVHHKVYNLAEEMDRKMYSDQTGRFPHRSYNGMQYIMVVYEAHFSNNIFVEPLRNRQAGEMVAAYQRAVDRMKKAGIQPKIHILDNEISAEFKNAIEANGMSYQLVPPNDHRRNIAEKAIQVFKDHFISVLCGTAENFPMQLWDQLLPHAELQLSLLRKSRVDSTKSAYEVMYGKNHDYNANPWAPLGCAVQVHVMPRNRKSWEPHTKAGFYVGNSVDHYRCHRVWVVETRNVRVGQTVFFKHKYLTQPPVTQADALLRATDDVCDLLRGKVPVKGDVRTALDMLMDIFSEQAEKTITTPTDTHREQRSRAHANRTTTEEETVENQAIPNEIELGDDDVRTTRTAQIRHPPPSGPHLIEDDEPPNFRVTRASRRRQLLSAVEVSGSCPTARQTASRKFPMQFLCDFAGAVLDAETGDLLEYRQLIKNPKHEKE